MKENSLMDPDLSAQSPLTSFMNHFATSNSSENPLREILREQVPDPGMGSKNLEQLFERACSTGSDLFKLKTSADFDGIAEKVETILNESTCSDPIARFSELLDNKVIDDLYERFTEQNYRLEAERWGKELNTSIKFLPQLVDEIIVTSDGIIYKHKGKSYQFDVSTLSSLLIPPEKLNPELLKGGQMEYLVDVIYGMFFLGQMSIIALEQPTYETCSEFPILQRILGVLLYHPLRDLFCSFMDDLAHTFNKDAEIPQIVQLCTSSNDL